MEIKERLDRLETAKQAAERRAAVAQAKREAAESAQATVLAQLKDEYEVDGVPEAVALLKGMLAEFQEEADKAEALLAGAE